MFPRLVFKCPGPNPRAGGTYASLLVSDEQGHDDALAAGWYATLPDAISPPVAVESVIPPDDAPPTRAELEIKADELGLKFDGRTSDAKLGKMIAEALSGMV